MDQTSTSDNKTYPEICLAAASYEAVFKDFKRNPSYMPILEHVCCEEGQHYYDNIKNADVLANIKKFTVNDMLGSPNICNYEFGSFSPTTLRYVKILSDLSEFNLNDKTIVEIGAGYGGQYTIIRQMFKPKKYVFIDLHPTLLLIKKYISKLGLDDIELEFIEGNNVAPINSDIVISNYAFSECMTSIQDLYIKNVIDNSSCGYMIYNNQNGYTHEQFKNICNKYVTVSNEVPNTNPNNVLVTW